MAEIFKHIYPSKYFNDYISRNVRPDGRKFDEHRDVKVNINAITSADASAAVKCGNSTVVCGIKLELAKPKAEEPDTGFLISNVELLPLCSSKFRPGPPSDHAQVINNIVSDIVMNSKCIDLKDLCLVHDKLAWVVYCDLVCLDYDGSIVDACIVAIMTSLKTLLLPSVSFDAETEEVKVDTSARLPLKIHGLPVATSFGIYEHIPRNIVLADPSAYEEEMCGGVGANLIVCWNKGLFCGIQKFGGSNLSTEDEKRTLVLAKEISKLVEGVIETCIKNDKVK
ncbi:exosome complex component RRP43-like [Pararge aegeria]|uniref:Ribosomal RNA-processing protein 43 n=2 Tax=Pararge aegeria TaxID=116150 RepID=A0A8S4RMV3_9NEOP|nr:exosome complex component RRP43-like [Pararge aegeria]CAH2238766.1 jg11646 [Pararge aegeria aegeria]